MFLQVCVRPRGDTQFQVITQVSGLKSFPWVPQSQIISQVSAPGSNLDGVPLAGDGVPPTTTSPGFGQQREYLLRGRQYASCVKKKTPPSQPPSTSD